MDRNQISRMAALFPLAGCVGLSLAACHSADPPPTPAGRLHVAVAPLDLPDVDDACYRLTVLNGSGATVWQEGGICADRFGDGRGAITWVGPCDAADPQNVARLELEELFDGGGALARSTYRNPCGHLDNGNHDGFPPCELPVRCEENTDVAVSFDLVVMRDARQGFFDVAVNFEDVFCSAKVDCQDALLHGDGDGGARGPTVVVAFACTSGEDQPTWLHMSDVAVVCDGGTTWLDPHLGPGQVGAQSDAVWELATYRGQEAFADLDKCYWNLAFGLDLGPEGAARECRLIAHGTASRAPFDDSRRSPAGWIYPYIAFDVALTDASARFVCAQHPLDEPGSGVSTGYTPPSGRDFPWSWRCGAPPPIGEGRILCGGQSGSEQGSFVHTPAGVVFGHGEALSPIYQLPSGLRLQSCCGNPCPGCQ